MSVLLCVLLFNRLLSCYALRHPLSPGLEIPAHQVRVARCLRKRRVTEQITQQHQRRPGLRPPARRGVAKVVPVESRIVLSSRTFTPDTRRAARRRDGGRRVPCLP